MSLDTLIKNIQKRPEMYLYSPEITNLLIYLDGYYYALNQHNIENKDREFWEKFQSWVSNKYSIKSTQGWAQIILFFSGNEYEAFKEFFILYEEFKAAVAR